MDLINSYGIFQEITNISINSVSRTLSTRQIERALQKSLGGASLAICLHRITDSNEETTKSPLTITTKTLEKILHSLNHVSQGHGAGEILVTFDDGYSETLEFIENKKHLFPNLSWIYFICPQKCARNENYVWDREETTISSLEKCLEASQKYSFKIGNHTNTHRAISTLSDKEIENEINDSIEILERYKIPHRDFAFPFGYPGVHFTDKQTKIIKRIYLNHGINAKTWSTEPYPFNNTNEKESIPRIPILGTETASSSLSKILMQSIKLKIKSITAKQ